ncbi:hypothetical protein K461DRAFT_301651 [Myriangium duriaei CBS 260.36]|uniref:Uncharacterized protein n=1 Tax=Myriangium duriaei CBS 260.36 TaxID=1168546 RepID=A0A9P4MCS9_9PEZI|nr:hypothetical protein K461DRAFT_301651 [Myriangium duriaei CBS 260.36]
MQHVGLSRPASILSPRSLVLSPPSKAICLWVLQGVNVPIMQDGGRAGALLTNIAMLDLSYLPLTNTEFAKPTFRMSSDLRHRLANSPLPRSNLAVLATRADLSCEFMPPLNVTVRGVYDPLSVVLYIDAMYNLPFGQRNQKKGRREHSFFIGWWPNDEANSRRAECGRCGIDTVYRDDTKME